MSGKCQEFSFFRSKSHMTSVLTNQVMLCLGGGGGGGTNVNIFISKYLKPY